ncbi:Uncharacterised protein [Leclercia adecarboxylata]|uniref:Uncharacterized protein n=1 Tax=Leclercia adecarboxylata TaxID=83655 RepID=A0A4U9I0U3_9ENTR|nr:Uncharacterised protein [Leclercia adecarboxylata]
MTKLKAILVAIGFTVLMVLGAFGLGQYAWTREGRSQSG